MVKEVAEETLEEHLTTEIITDLEEVDHNKDEAIDSN